MRFIEALRNRKLLKGMILTTPSCEMAEAVSFAGLDWAFIDLEHAPIDVFDAQNIVRSLGDRIAAIIRIPDLSPTHIKKALDTGCDGILAPQVNTREDALAVVNAAKYPPAGQRSVGIGRAHKYGADFQGYINSANSKIAVIIQIENIKAVENIDGILSVPGVDAVFIGPYDLSASMNMPGQIDNAAVQAAINAVFVKAKQAKMPVGIFSATIESAKLAMGKGATLLAIGIDTLLLVEAAKKIATIDGKPE